MKGALFWTLFLGLAFGAPLVHAAPAVRLRPQPGLPFSNAQLTEAVALRLQVETSPDSAALDVALTPLDPQTVRLSLSGTSHDTRLGGRQGVDAARVVALVIADLAEIASAQGQAREPIPASPVLAAVPSSSPATLRPGFVAAEAAGAWAPGDSDPRWGGALRGGWFGQQSWGAVVGVGLARATGQLVTAEGAVVLSARLTALPLEVGAGWRRGARFLPPASVFWLIALKATFPPVGQTRMA